MTRAAGFHLVVRPTVFHPRYFLTSEFFAAFISRLDLSGKCVADICTGTGILALACARAGAAKVVAIDINQYAARSVAENALANQLEDCVMGVAFNLLSAIAPRPLFDVNLSSPPPFLGNRQILLTVPGSPVRTTATLHPFSIRPASGSHQMAASIFSFRPIPILCCWERSSNEQGSAHAESRNDLL